MADVLGGFEQAVLLAMIHLGDEAYGRAILKEVERRLKRSVENKGLVTSRLGSGTPVRAGRPRRYYRLEPSGRRALNDARAAIEALWSGLQWPLKGRV